MELFFQSCGSESESNYGTANESLSDFDSIHEDSDEIEDELRAFLMDYNNFIDGYVINFQIITTLVRAHCKS